MRYVRRFAGPRHFGSDEIQVEFDESEKDEELGIVKLIEYRGDGGMGYNHVVATVPLHNFESYVRTPTDAHVGGTNGNE